MVAKEYSVADSINLAARSTAVKKANNECGFVRVGVSSKKKLYANLKVTSVSKSLVYDRSKPRKATTPHPNENRDFGFYFGNVARVAGPRDLVEKAVGNIFNEDLFLDVDKFFERNSDAYTAYVLLLDSYKRNECSTFGTTWTLNEMQKVNKYKTSPGVKWVEDKEANRMAEEAAQKRNAARNLDFAKAVIKAYDAGGKGVNLGALTFGEKSVSGLDWVVQSNSGGPVTGSFTIVGATIDGKPFGVAVRTRVLGKGKTDKAIAASEAKQQAEMNRMAENWGKLVDRYPIEPRKFDTILREVNSIGVSQRSSKKRGQPKAGRDTSIVNVSGRRREGSGRSGRSESEEEESGRSGSEGSGSGSEGSGTSEKRPTRIAEKPTAKGLTKNQPTKLPSGSPGSKKQSSSS